MKKLYSGVFVLLLLLAAVIAPTTYRTAQEMFAGQAPVYDNIDHAAHHEGVSQYLGGGK